MYLQKVNVAGEEIVDEICLEHLSGSSHYFTRLANSNC